MQGRLIGAASVCASILWLTACQSTDPGSTSKEPDRASSTGTHTCVMEKGSGGVPPDLRVLGKRLRGDVDGDGRADRVTLRVSASRPEKCRHAVVVDRARGRSLTAFVAPLEWPSPAPRLLLLAEIDGRAGLEPVVSLSPGAVYRPGTVFTVQETRLVRVRLKGAGLFPFYDEFPAGVDCTDRKGEIVVTTSRLGPGGDSVFTVTRTLFRASGAVFKKVSEEQVVVDCCNGEARRRWPEVADDPFRSCGDRSA